MIIKRLCIIRQVNDVIEKVCTSSLQEDNGKFNSTDGNDERETISLKKLVKIMNLCHIYIPLIQCKPNNSTLLSLDIVDLMELCKNKEVYKNFVDL